MKLSWFLSLCLAFTGLCQAEALISVQKTVDRTSAEIGNENFSFRISYNCVSITKDAKSAVLTDVLDNNFELVSTTQSTHMDNVQVTGNTVKFIFKNTLKAGSTGDVTIQARFKASTAAGYNAKNKVTATANNSDTVTSNEVTISARAPAGNTAITYDRKLDVYKQSPETVYQNGGRARYAIFHGVNYPAGSNVPDYTVTDNFPAGMALDYFDSDTFWGQDRPINVFYRTNWNTNWRSWTGNPRYRTSGRQQVRASELTLGAGEYVSGLQFRYGNMTGGPGFHRSNLAEPIQIFCIYRGNAAPNTLLENCANTAATNLAGGQHCANNRTLVLGPAPVFHFYSDGKTPDRSYTWGETFEQRLTVAVDNFSSIGYKNPEVGMLLPLGFSFVGYLGHNSPHTVANPNVTQEPNFDGTGRTLVRLRWGPTWGNAYELPPSNNVFGWSNIQMRLNLRVENSVSNGSHELSYFAKATPEGGFFGWNETDTRDFDKDGNRSEVHGYTRSYANVLVNNGSASLLARMEVRGELDTVAKSNPEFALTTPAGAADYTLRIRNDSGVLFDQLQIIDILPHVGDRGVIDPSARGSTFEPYLVGPISAPGATVSYSLSKNPCRPELVASGPAGCEPPNWSTSLPADITRVKSVKLDFGGSTLNPNQELVIGWPMRVPLGAPTGATDIAWNSFGMAAKRKDDNTNLLPTEPQRTGVKVNPPVPPYLGDYVWLDKNANGIQDDGTDGINGLRVELWKDNGDNVADLTKDTFVKFSATYTDGATDGKYLFANFTPGKYFVVVFVPNTLGVTLPNVGADDADNDGIANVFGGSRVAIGPVMNIVIGQEERSCDFGLVDRSSMPAVWASVPTNSGVLIGGRFSNAGGVARKNIALLNGNGSANTSFNPGAGFNNEVLALAVQTNGSVVAGGVFTEFNTTKRNGLSFVNADGTLGADIPQPDMPNVRWVEAAGSFIYVGGGFSKLGGTPRQGVARLTATGVLDGGFNSAMGANGLVNCGAVQSNGGVIIAGAFTSYAGTPAGRIVKLNADGTRDASFNVGSGADGEILAMKQLNDGRLILAGRFTAFAGRGCRNTIRLKADGTVDTAMGDNDLSVNSINTAN
jgi:hypothetical protein